MQLILSRDVKNLGRKADVVEVARGYARNFLLSRGLAYKASKDEIAKIARLKEQEQERKEKVLVKREEIKQILSKKRISLKVPAAETGTLYAAISKDAILQAVYETYGVELTENSLKMNPIKSLGLHQIKVAIRDNGEVAMKVKVQSLNE